MTGPSTERDDRDIERDLGRVVDVVVIGDGPAGSALAQACTRLGLDAVLVGPDAEWSATYGCWVDDVADLGADGWFANVLPTIRVAGHREFELPRPYGVIDNAALRTALREGVVHRSAHVERVEPGARHHRVVLAPRGAIEARIVIDAAGWPSRFAPEAARRARTVQPAWQTAVGVVLPDAADGDLGTATLMDFRPAPGGTSDRASTIGPAGVTSFAYSLPVVDGWLVEETVLAGRPAVEPVALLARLAARLGRHPDDLLAGAVRSEFVRIPMGAPLPAPGQPVVVFGAAAGYIHPATGYSIAASLRAAPRVAASIASTCRRTTGSEAADAAPVWEAVWPTALRRTRVLHDFGLDTLTRLDGEGTREFFDTFFDLPVDQWSAYLRIDTPPAETAQVMTRLFKGSSWRLRRRLAATNPMAFARLVRP